MGILALTWTVQKHQVQSVSVLLRGVDLEQGDREFLDCLGEVGPHDTAAQAIVPHQAPPAVLAQIEVLQPPPGGSRIRGQVACARGQGLGGRGGAR